MPIVVTYSLCVRHKNSDCLRSSVYTRQVVITLGKYQHDLPDELGYRDVTVRNGICRTVGSGPANTKWSRHDIHFVLSTNQSSKIVFHVGPWTLIVVRSLRNHIRHQVSFLVDGNAVLVIAIGIWSHVTEVKAG